METEPRNDMERVFGRPVARWSYAGFKKRFTVGTVFDVTHETAPERCNGRRVVTCVQTNAIVSQFVDGSRVILGGSWCYWPPAAHVTITGDSIRFAEPGYDGYTYTIVTDGEPKS